MNEDNDLQPPVPEPPQADEQFALNPNESRFLFVEVAAQRAKQLRRGALNRLAPAEPAEGAASETPVPAHKPERVAMEEVRLGYIRYGMGEKSLLPPKAEDPS
ncbi:MAG: DNA-directed RNA polymerase subunit omega [Vicinamibacterales bacterium]